MTTFNVLEQAIRNAPITWTPALLKAAVEAAVEKQVFQPGKLSETINKWIIEHERANTRTT